MRGGALGLGLVLGLVLFVPLRWLVPDGLAASRVTGTAWQGRIEGLRLGPMAAGDVEVALEPGALLRGERRLRLRGGDGVVRTIRLLPSGEIGLVE
jgi:hypothetical protein